MILLHFLVQHYRLFPKSLGDVLTTYQVQELHLSQTQGVWRYDKWGYPPEDAAPGAELLVWFLPQASNIDKLWSDLVNALSGLFCSSLNFMDSKSTVIPRWTFRPAGLADEGYSLQSARVRYSALPKEIVCTENLTPWKKLLPCNSKDSECKSSAVELKQTLTLVYDPPTTNRNGKQDWNFRNTYSTSLSSQCPLASSSKIFVDMESANFAPFTLKPEPTRIETFRRVGEIKKYAVYDLKEVLGKQGKIDLTALYPGVMQFSDIVPPPVYASRYVTGYGLEKGGITCQIHNTLSENITVIYMETIPWFLRVYFNSLKVENNGATIKPFKIHYIPGKDRSQPYQLELVFRLRAQSTTKISLSFDRAFLKWTEYPPDANHGFYVNSAVISTILPTSVNNTAVQQHGSTIEDSMNDQSEQLFLRLHTESLLVSLPTPDFSMPYNVICLACTVVAIAFGSIHNLTTRRFQALDPSKQKKGILSKIKSKLFKSSNLENSKSDSSGKTESEADKSNQKDDLKDDNKDDKISNDTEPS
ncbi:hypothetical protein FSP39_001351 [Pinctada imbricata]|uniref:GPI transamidase component PIG-T n=1 Tax=Pinctada imbricata TaxID=66713 RepID=A0AA88XPW8_PINIB|nr:hypothetical protein FSP39_001351 [Pinctada imbricata]